MSGVDWLVFSRDRACQLDALLASIERHATEHTRTVSVLYRTTSTEYALGYGRTRRRWPWAWHAPEFHFKTQVWTWLEQASDVVGFLCDDDLFYRPTPAVLELPRPFSFRLGLNCTRQHPTGIESIAPKILTRHGDRGADDVISWEWRGAAGDWGYPFSLDGHVYDREHVLELVDRIAFSDPTTLEAGVVSGVVGDALPFPPRYFAPVHSCLVSIPANRVTEHSHNPIAADGLGVDELNRLYLDHRHIDPERMDFSGVDGAHAEVPYVLTP